MRTAKTLIRLSGCPGWSESSLGAHSFCWFCHVVAQLCDYNWTTVSWIGVFLNICFYSSITWMKRQPRSAILLGDGNSKLIPVCLDMPCPSMQRLKSLIVSTGQRWYSNVLWSTANTTGHIRSCGKPLHPYLLPEVSTRVLPLSTVRSGRESEVDSVHIFLTITQLAAFAYTI